MICFLAITANRVAKIMLDLQKPTTVGAAALHCFPALSHKDCKPIDLAVIKTLRDTLEHDVLELVKISALVPRAASNSNKWYINRAQFSL